MDLKEAIRGGPSSSVTSAVVLVVLILPLLGLWTSSLFFIRREDNATPTAAFTYMKIVYPIAFLCVNPALGTSNSVYSLIRALTFQLIHLVLEIAMRRIPLPPGPNEEDFSHRMAYMSNVLDALSSTLLDITDIFLILALFELGNGFLERLTGKSPSFPLVVRYTLLLPSALILYLAVATHVRSYYIWSESLLAGEDSEQRLQEDIKELEEWDTPLLALWWAASLLLFAYACFLWNKAKGAKGNAQVLDSTVTFLAATVLNLFNPVRQAVMTTLDLDTDGYQLIKDYLYLIDDVLDYWVRFFIIALIFAMGLPTEKGLWTIISQLYSAPLESARSIKE